jgi:hypothetical protein
MQVERAKTAVNAERFERDCTVRLLHRVVTPPVSEDADVAAPD